MNTAEFLSRWSRRKRRATALAAAANVPDRSPPSIPEQHATRHDESWARDPSGDVGSTQAPRAQPVSASDLPNLASLETIGAETDIRAFLAAGVPTELTRAALRRAWLSDPKIRDFVGLADYDWDFNTPGSMAGFGMIQEADQIECELSRLLRGAAAVTTSEAPVSPAPIGTFQARDEEHSAGSGEPGDHTRLDDESTFDEATRSAPQLAEPADRPFHRQRRHGRALPK